MDLNRVVRPRQQQFQDNILKLYPELLQEGKFPIMVITIAVTEACPLRCTYCYQHGKNSTRMTKEIGKKAIDSLIEESLKGDGYVSRAKAVILEFIGGEPLMEIDLIDYMVEYFKYKTYMLNHPWKNNYMLNITTNGVLYESPKVLSFIERNENRLNIAITIDGNKALHDSCRVFEDGSGSYDIVAAAFKKNLARNIVKNTKMTISPDNLPHLFEGTVHLYEEIGLEEIFANCVFESGWTYDHATTLYEQLVKLADYLLSDKRYQLYANSFFDTSIGQKMTDDQNENWCGGTGKMLGVSTDGQLYPCLRYMPFSLKGDTPEFSIGDIENGIGNTPERQERINSIKCITRRSQSTDECYNCPIGTGCAWCSAYNYEEFGTPNKRATYICPMHKARVLANAYYWNKLYIELGAEERFKLNIPKEWALDIISEEEYEMLKRLQEIEIEEECEEEEEYNDSIRKIIHTMNMLTML